MTTDFNIRMAQARAYLLDPTTQVPTGFPTLDKYLKGGIKYGQVAGLIARTRVGKTSLALNIATNAIAAGHRAAIASLEMVAEEVAIRTLSMYLKKSIEETEEMLMSDIIQPDLLSAQEDLTNLHIWDKPRPQWEELLRWCEQVKPGLLVIDHMALMGQYGYPRGQVERTRVLFEDAKKFAKEAQTALLVIHQTGRNVEGDASAKNHGDRPPQLEDLLYAGEQDLDYCFGIWRPALAVDMAGTKKKLLERDVYVSIIKNRFGEELPEGVPVEWLLPSMKFVEKTSPNEKKIDNGPKPAAGVLRASYTSNS